MKSKVNFTQIKKYWPLAAILLLAIFAAITASKYLTARAADVEERLADKAAKTRVTVIVPTRNLSPDEVLSLDFLVKRSVPSEYVNQDAITQDMLDRFLGKKITRAVSKGTPLLQSFVEMYEYKPFSASIEAGMRAITIPVDEINSVSGMLTAGDKVDFLVLTQMNLSNSVEKSDMHMFPLLENITVRATGTTTVRELSAQNEQVANPRNPNRPAGSYNTLTIAVSPRDAQRLVLAQQSGRIIAFLRRPDDAALYGKMLSTSEAFGLTPAPTPVPVQQPKYNTVGYIIGGNFGSGSQEKQIAVGAPKNGSAPAGMSPETMQKLMESMGSGG